MTTLPERIKSGEVEAPDLFCGGTPCQAFSVAGLRNSLADDRGNLSLTFVEIANAIDNRRQNLGHVPAIIFWENVPGVLSTKDNAFGCFLGALAGENEPVIPAGDKWTNAGCVYGPQRTVAWRVLDAQYFGVAQRRRRVFVVASARDDFNPAEVLFESEGVRRDTAPRRETGEAVAASAGASAAFGGMSPVAETLTANTGGMTRPAGNANELDFCVPMGCEFGPSGGRLTDLNPTLDTHAKDGPVRNQLAGAVLTMAHGQGGAEIATDRAPTLTCNHEAPIAAYAIQGSMIGRNDNAGPQGDGINEEVCFTQNCVDKHAVAYGIPGNWIGRKPENGGNATEPMHDIAPCLTKTDVHGVAQPVAFVQNSRDEVRLMGGDGSIVGALAAETGAKQQCYVAQPIPIDTMNMTRGHSSGGLGFGQPGDPSFTLTKGHSHAVAQPIAYALDSLSSNSMKSSNPISGCNQVNVSKTLDTSRGLDPSCNQGGIAVAFQVEPPVGVFQDSEFGVKQYDNAGTLRAGRIPEHQMVMHSMAVRRLTPVECERLQGFPDGYTNIPWSKKEESPDGPRYKALGNSWAVPVVRWIGRRIQAAIQ
jgi:site-specific DNA-cytosine methylase